MSKDEEVRTVEGGEGPGKQPRARIGKKGRVAAISVVAVLAVAAIGFNAWHSTPEFCGAICHTPMDAYVATYVQGDEDKFGNDLDETQAKGMMSYLHKVVEGDGSAAAACLDCHEPTIGEQVTEGMHWISGDYEVAGENAKGDVILPSKTFEQLTEARGSNAEAFCLTAGCHVNDDGSDMQRADLEAATAGLSDARNPHKAQHGELACGTCHKGHSQSVNYCSQCHTDAPIPEGWMDWIEASQRGLA